MTDRARFEAELAEMVAEHATQADQQVEPGSVRLEDLDSLDVFEFVSAVERRYGIRIEDDELDEMTDLETLAGLITAKRDAAT